MLAKQFLPEIAIFRERAKFYRAEQQRGEDVKTWYARLKNLSVNCKFGEHLEPLLLDKFIVGMPPGPVQDRLCEENEKLTLKDALDLAANRESAIQDEIIADGLAEMHLGRHKHRHGHRGRRHQHDQHDHDYFAGGRHGRHHGRHGGHHHGGPPPHGPHGGHHHGGPPHHGHVMEFGFGPRGPHAWGGHPMDRFGPRGFRGCEGMRMRRRDLERWSKMCRKMRARQASSSSSSSGSSSSSSGSSSESETEGEKKCKGRRHKGHKKHGHGHHGRFGNRREGEPGKCPRGKRCGRKEQQQVVEPVATENTEPELIE